MIIDNTELIKKLIAGCQPGEFYMLQVLHRSKDGKTPYEPEGKKISQQTIKTYYISSPEYLDYKMNEIRDLCKMFNARAYINLNKKSWKKISLKALEILASAIAKGDDDPNTYKDVKTIVDSACGQTGACDKNKTWVVDVDSKDEEIEIVRQAIDLCEPLGEKVVADIPTLHGYHLITKPFNKAKFHQLYGKEIDLHNNNPTLLFVNKEDE